MHNLPEMKTIRRELRSRMTPAEARLWSYIKHKNLEGRKFRRQQSVNRYVLDFYCPAERLAIELDGDRHCSLSARESDRKRDLFLAQFNILVLRIENRHVFENPQGVLRYIRDHFGWLEKQPPRPSATPP